MVNWVIVYGCRLLQTVESLFRANGVLRNITRTNYPRSLAELSKNILQTICYIRTLRKHLPVVVFKKSSFLFHISTCECSRYIFFKCAHCNHYGKIVWIIWCLFSIKYILMCNKSILSLFDFLKSCRPERKKITRKVSVCGFLFSWNIALSTFWLIKKEVNSGKVNKLLLLTYK